MANVKECVRKYAPAGDGMSVRNIELIEMHAKCEDLLVFGHVTKQEVAELAEALLRLIRKANVTYDQKV